MTFTTAFLGRASPLLVPRIFLALLSLSLSLIQYGLLYDMPHARTFLCLLSPYSIMTRSLVIGSSDLCLTIRHPFYTSLHS